MTLRLYLHKPKIVFAAQFDLSTPAAYPQEIIAFKNVTLGSYTDLREGMTVLLGTAPGKDDLGRLRYKRMDDLWPTTVMVVSRFSEGVNDGEGTQVNDSYITVLEEYRVWAKIPRMIGAVIRKDGDIAAFGNVDAPPPVANAGPGVAGTVFPDNYLPEPDAGYFYATFSGSESWQHNEAGTPPIGGINPGDFLWDVGTGTIVLGTATSQQITVRFPDGFTYVSLTVTGSGDKTHTTHVPVFARDEDDDLSISDFQVRSHLHTLTGQEVTIEFFSPLPRDLYPDGCLMMLWDDDIAYDSNSPTSRNHMQFVGWHQRDEAKVEGGERATLHSTTLTFYDVCRRLSVLPGFPQVQEYSATPGSWMHTKYPNVLYYFWYLLYWHSTALEVADLLLGSSGATLALYEYVTLGSDRASLYDQVNSLAAQVTPDHRLTCSRQGQMRLVVNPQIQNVDDRNQPVGGDFDDSDWVSVTYSYARPPRVNQIRTMAIKSSRNYVVVDGKNTIEVIASVAPGEAHGQGESNLEINERIATNQDVLNICEGNRYANMNARYGPFTITTPFDYRVEGFDISLPHWVILTITAANHPERELPTSFTNQRGLATEMTVSYDYQETGLVRTVSLRWEMETSGKPAQTVTLWPDTPDAAVLAAQGTADSGLLTAG